MENTPKKTQETGGKGAPAQGRSAPRRDFHTPRPGGGVMAAAGTHPQGAARVPAGRDGGSGSRPPFRGGGRGGRDSSKEGGAGRPRRGGSPRRERVRPEFEQKVVNIRRVTRVVAGGRRFSFSVVMILGDRKGTVGVGIGKAGDTALAIEKAMKDAKKNMIKVPLTKTMSISHPVSAKYSASTVMISPAPGGGLVAGSSVRNVLQLAGITDVMSKIHSRSRNRLNNARVTIEALKKLKRVALAAPIAAIVVSSETEEPIADVASVK